MSTGVSRTMSQLPENHVSDARHRNPVWLQIAEIVGVFAIGIAVLLCGLTLGGTNLVAKIASIWAANLVMLGAIYAGLRLRGQRWEHLGLRRDVWNARELRGIFLRSIPVFLFATLAFVAGAILMANIFGIPEQADMSKYDYLRGNLGLTLLALASVYVVSSFAEEVIYRGFLITRSLAIAPNSKIGKWLAVVLSAAVFGLVHSDWGVPGMVQATCMGVALGISYLKVNRNLWVTILAHAYMDTILILQMY